jgi:hypothetical protein
MKIKKSIFQISGMFILLLLIQSVLYACPKCNQDFYNQLLGQRANTLGGQELLEAIRNQSVSGEKPGFVIPATFNNGNNITQSFIPNTSDSVKIINNSDNHSTSSAGYFPYITIFIQLIFFGQLIS